jgi:hypothetical protein
MARDPVTEELLGRKVTSQPLPFPQAEALLPEVGELLALMAQELGDALSSGKINLKDDVMKLAPVLGKVSQFFGGGRLQKLSPRILACTTIVMPDMKGELANYELSKEKDRTYTFDEQPELYFPTLFFAGRVTFQRFFPASVLTAAATRTPSS